MRYCGAVEMRKSAHRGKIGEAGKIGGYFHRFRIFPNFRIRRLSRRDNCNRRHHRFSASKVKKVGICAYPNCAHSTRRFSARSAESVGIGGNSYRPRQFPARSVRVVSDLAGSRRDRLEFPKTPPSVRSVESAAPTYLAEYRRVLPPTPPISPEIG